MIKKYKKQILGSSLVLILSSSCAFTALALPAEAPDTGYAKSYARLEDNEIDYDELSDLVKNFYGPIKRAYDTATDPYTKDMGDMSSSMFDAARDLETAADDLEDAVKDGQVPGGEAMAQVYANRAIAKNYRSAAQSMGLSIGISTRDDSKGMKAIERQVNQIVYSLQSAMNGYDQVMANREAASKGVEAAEAARDMKQSMENNGLAVSADVISAAASLTLAKARLQSLDTQAQSIKKTLCMFTGWGPDGDPVIGTVPSADVAAIGSIDVNADKEKAVNNNYALISLRGAKAGNMSQVEQVMTKPSTQARNKLENVEYNENTVRSTVQTLYDTILEKKTAYDSASTAWEAARNNWKAAQIQNANGSLGSLQYKQQELAYLQAKAAYRTGDLNLQQAIQDYHWEVAGLTVKVE